MEKEGDSVSYLTILDNPSVPLVPVAPKIPVFILGGMVVGFMLGVFGAARFEYKHREDLAPIDGALALDVPLLGELPRLEDGVARALTDKGFLQSAALPEA
jgi:capsular polysaccharide biosynthesis protein